MELHSISRFRTVVGWGRVGRGGRGGEKTERERCKPIITFIWVESDMSRNQLHVLLFLSYVKQ